MVEATEQTLAPGVTVEHVRDGLCNAAIFAIARMTAPIDKKARGKLKSARKTIAKYDMIMSDLRAQGIRVPELPEKSVEQASQQIGFLLENPGRQRRADYIRSQLYPYFLALYELSFATAPTAYYYDAGERDGPTLAFVRQAAVELDDAFSTMFANVPGATALLGGPDGGTLAVSLPHGDSLRRALEPFIKARGDIKNSHGAELDNESPEANAYRCAYNLLRFRVFQYV